MVEIQPLSRKLNKTKCVLPFPTATELGVRREAANGTSTESSPPFRQAAQRSFVRRQLRTTWRGQRRSVGRAGGSLEKKKRTGAVVVVKTVLGSHFGCEVNSPPILGPILVVGLNRIFTGTIWMLTLGSCAGCSRGFGCCHSNMPH